MKNLIFSKQYLKTKLAILTSIITVVYHYLCKDINLNDSVKHHFYSNKKEEFSVSDNKDQIQFNDEDTLRVKFKEDPFDENAAIIPSKWVLEYWMSIRRRRPGVNIPSLSKEIAAELDLKKVQVSGFFDSKIVKAVLEFCKVNKNTKISWWDIIPYLRGLLRESINERFASVFDFFKPLARFFY